MLEIRDVIALVGVAVSIAGSFAVASYKSSEALRKTEKDRAAIGGHESRLSVLEEKAKWQGGQIEGLVSDLKGLVASLQKLALDLAKLTER